MSVESLENDRLVQTVINSVDTKCHMRVDTKPLLFKWDNSPLIVKFARRTVNGYIPMFTFVFKTSNHDMRLDVKLYNELDKSTHDYKLDKALCCNQSIERVTLQILKYVQPFDEKASKSDGYVFNFDSPTFHCVCDSVKDAHIAIFYTMPFSAAFTHPFDNKMNDALYRMRQNHMASYTISDDVNYDKHLTLNIKKES